jgi:diguanylate cyclase (GGDEF)-like protein
MNQSHLQLRFLQSATKSARDNKLAIRLPLLVFGPIAPAYASEALYSATTVFEIAIASAALATLIALIVIAKKNREIRIKQEQVNQLKSELETTSITDSLTGLYNRRYMDEQLKTALSYAKRQQSPLTITLVDIDLFKSVNDKYGHHRGDSVLRDFAAIVRPLLRNEDIASRYGGEEFILILPGTELAGGIICAERLRQAVEQKGLNALSLTVSAGVASTEFYADRTADELIDRAEKALYAAKDRGRNLVVSEIDLDAVKPNINKAN